MVTLRFLPQPTLDGWSEEGKVDLQVGRILETATKAEFPVREAVHFVKVESGPDDQSLLNKVKTVEQLKALGAEHYLTSVILGETVYEVVPGWIAEEPGDRAPVAAVSSSPVQARPAAGGAKPGKGFEGKNQEADMLAKLLLDKLS